MKHFFPRTICTAAVALAGLATVRGADLPAKVTFADHVLPIFRNACLNCHNPDKKKAGLDLSTYQGTIGGSDNGKIVESGNAGNSLLFKCVKQTEEPKMPPKGDRLSDSDLAVLEKWIAGQLLENAGSKGVAASNNVQAAVVSLERPAGPPPMPGDLPLEPIVRTKATNALVAMGASPWAPLVAIGGQKQILLYHTETLQQLGVLPFPEGFPAIIRFSRNGKLLLTGGGLGGKSGKVVLWDVTTGERAGSVGEEFDQVLGADLSPDQVHVALGGPSKVLKIFSTKDGKLVHSLKKHTDWITAVAFSPDGAYLASADRNGGIVVWEGATGREFVTLPGHKVIVTGLAFMPGVLASASQDGTVVLWDVKEGKEIRKWNAHAGGAEWVEFTPDGRLVTCGRDKVAKVWDQTGKILLTSEPFGDIALRAVLSAERVVAGDWTGRIRVFSVATTKPLGELTSNPPSIAEQLAAEEKRLADAKAALEAAEGAFKAAEEKAGSRADQTTVAAPPAPEPATKVAELEKELETLTAEITKRRAERAAQKEGTPEYDAANAKVQEAKPRLADLQMKVENARKATSGVVATAAAAPAGGGELAKAKIDLDAAQVQHSAAAATVEHWRRAQSFMTVHTARKTFADQKARYEELQAEAKTALAPVELAAAELAAAEKRLAQGPSLVEEASKAVAAAAVRAEAARQSVLREDAAVLAADDKAAASAKVHAAAVADVDAGKPAIAAEEARIAGVQKELEALTAGVVTAREERGKLAAATPEFAAADAKVQALKTQIAETEKMVADLSAALVKTREVREALLAKLPELKTAIETAKAAATAASQAREKVRAEAKTIAGEVLAAEKKVAEIQKENEGMNERIASLRAKAPEIARMAKAAKAKAEAEALALSRQLEGARVNAQRAQAAFESQYKPQTKAAAATAPPSSTAS